MKIEPRVIRAGQAPAYLGMSSPHFNTHVRPFLVEVKDAAKMISFDRLDLDAWWEQHKQANGKPAKCLIVNTNPYKTITYCLAFR